LKHERFKDTTNKQKNKWRMVKMLKNKKLRLTVVFTITALLSLTILASPASAIVVQDSVSWFWYSDTSASSVASGDVDNDGSQEIVTGGYYNDGTRWVAQLVVWDAATLAVENVRFWYWNFDTQIMSVAIGNVDADADVEIVTGGSYFDGTRWVAQLVVWTGATLAFENVRTWYWTGDTQIASVKIANVDADADVEIVTGGSYFDGTRDNAQLVVWTGATLAFENVRTWYWTSNTYIESIAVANVDGDVETEIVTGGSYFDGTQYNAQLVVWSGVALALENVKSWYWTSNTYIESVVAGNVDADADVEIVTGGSFNNGALDNAQLVVWTGASLALENVKTWTNGPYRAAITSLAYGDVNNDAIVDIVTGGTQFDGIRSNAQITIQPGSTLLGNTGTNWYTTSETNIESIAIGNIGGSNYIISSGSHYDLFRSNAQLVVWG
jgi:hypothetical protein